MKLINLTPHEINIIIEGKNIAFPPSGNVARLTESEPETVDCEYPCIKPHSYGSIVGSDLRENIIVSGFVGEQCAKLGNYKNVFSPDTGPGGVIRDENGRITGTKRFIKWC